MTCISEKLHSLTGAGHILAGMLLCLTSTSVFAQQQYTQKDFKDLFLAAYSYHVVARVCNDSASIEKSSKVLRRVVNFGEHRKVLTDEARAYLQNPKEIISRGEVQYRKDRYIGCEQARDLVIKLDEVTKKLP